MRGMTQTELAEKYGLSQGDVSQSLCAAGVKPLEKIGRQKGVYDESAAVNAMIRRLEKRRDGFRNKAQMLQDKAEEISIKFVRTNRRKRHADKRPVQ